MAKRNADGTFAATFDGEFMQPEIYKGEAYVVDGPHGGEIIPLDACGDLGACEPTPCESFGDGKTFAGYRYGDAPAGMRELAEKLADYMQNKPAEVWTIERRKGWLYRLTASGYMDSTDWGIASTRREAYRELVSNYGDDD